LIFQFFEPLKIKPSSIKATWDRICTALAVMHKSEKAGNKGDRIKRSVKSLILGVGGNECNS
jgi:hypothetical protein